MGWLAGWRAGCQPKHTFPTPPAHPTTAANTHTYSYNTTNMLSLSFRYRYSLYCSDRAALARADAAPYHQIALHAAGGGGGGGITLMGSNAALNGVTDWAGVLRPLLFAPPPLGLSTRGAAARALAPPQLPPIVAELDLLAAAAAAAAAAGGGGGIRYAFVEDPIHTGTVSRAHLAVRRSAQELHLMDLGSPDGVYVNGWRMPAHQWMLLEHGTMVQLRSPSRTWKALHPHSVPRHGLYMPNDLGLVKLYRRFIEHILLEAHTDLSVEFRVYPQAPKPRDITKIWEGENDALHTQGMFSAHCIALERPSGMPRETVVREAAAASAAAAAAVAALPAAAAPKNPRKRKLVDDLTATLTCGICRDLLHDCRMLQCGHNYCGACLKNLVLSRPDPRTPVVCPECRHSNRGLPVALRSTNELVHTLVENTLTKSEKLRRQASLTATAVQTISDPRAAAFHTQNRDSLMERLHALYRQQCFAQQHPVVPGITLRIGSTPLPPLTMHCSECSFGRPTPVRIEAGRLFVFVSGHPSGNKAYHMSCFACTYFPEIAVVKFIVPRYIPGFEDLDAPAQTLANTLLQH
jgi:hypothetical protein